MRNKQAGSMVNSHSSFNLDTSVEFGKMASQRKVRLTQTLSIQDEQQLVEKLSQLITKSSQFDTLKVVERQGNQLERYGKTYDTVPEALEQFIQTRPSDKYLLLQEDYILERKLLIQKNLAQEIERIDALMPSAGGFEVDYNTYKKKQGQKMLQHFRKLIQANLGTQQKASEPVAKSEDTPEQFLEPFLQIYKEQLLQMGQKLAEGTETRSKFKLSTISERDLDLGLKPRPNRLTQSAVDEKMILEEKRKQLYDLEFLVLKIVIAVERVNYYTMGIILPRDQNLNAIPFFNSQQDPIYDIQSCLKIQSLIKSQIERLEQIEKQMLPAPQKIQPETSAYFSRKKEDLKLKSEFRKNFHSQKSDEHCRDIWREFLGDKSAQGQLSALKVNLNVRVASLDPKFSIMKHEVTIQLFYQPQVTGFPQVQLSNQSWLFTEIPFAKNLLAQDLVMIIKVFKQYDIPPRESKTKQKVNTKTYEPMKISILKAYSIINLSDRFFEKRMADGRVDLADEPIKFIQYDQKYNLDHDYDRILQDIREDELTSKYDDEITQALGLKLDFTFMSMINRNILALRLDQSQIVRQKHHWQRLVKDANPYDDAIKYHQSDAQVVYRKEIEQLNLSLLRQEDTINELKCTINHLTIDKSKTMDYQLYRVQAFLVCNDQHKSNINLKFIEAYYTYGQRQKFESHQTQLATLRKYTCYFNSECYLRVPITLRARDLQNFKLVFVVYVAGDLQTKGNRKISEAMVDTNPTMYPFYPFYFAKQALWDEGNLVGGDENPLDLKLYRFNSNKLLQEQLDLIQDPIAQSHLQIQLTLFSQKYSCDQLVNRIIDTPQGSVLDAVNQLTNNQVLVYHNRILNSLLHIFNNSDQNQSQQALQALLVVFKRFNSKELQSYKSLITHYSEKWQEGQQENDKRLLKKLLGVLEKIPGAIAESLESSLDLRTDEDNQKQIEQKLTHMPILLILVCRLFAREFQYQYAQIREKFNQNFRDYLDKQDLCIYRPDLVEAHHDKRRLMCSKPQQIMQWLVEDLTELQRKLKEKDTEVIAEESGEEDDGLDSMLQSTGDAFNERISQYQVRRSSVQLNEDQSDKHLSQLKKMANELKLFQSEFCRTIKDILLRISKYLHEEEQLQKDDELFCAKIELIYQLYSKEKQIQKEKTEFEKQKRTMKENEIKIVKEKLTMKDDEIKKEIVEAFKDVAADYSKYIQLFPQLVSGRLANYITRRRSLRKIFWRTLQQNLNAVLNFIDQKFVLALFDTNYLLKKSEKTFEKMKNNIIPYFDVCTTSLSPFQSQMIAQLKEIEKTNEDAAKMSKEMHEYEDREVDIQINRKVIALSEFLASDTMQLLPSDLQQPDETVQEQLATRIQVAIYQLLKMYKNQFKEEQKSAGGIQSVVVERRKDTTPAELRYLFLYRIAVFEKKFYEAKCNLLSMMQFNDERGPYPQVNGPLPPSLFSRQSVEFKPISISYKGPRDFDDDELMTGLQSSKRQINDQGQQILNMDGLMEEANEVDIIFVEKKSIAAQDNKDRQSQVVLRLNDSMKLGLGAQKEHQNINRTDSFLNQFQEQDRRLCYFLNELEEAMLKYQELESQYMSVQELKDVKSQYISLFQVIDLAYLQSLSLNAFKLLYCNRPGCLDRLVKKVSDSTRKLEFEDHEMYFRIKKLQVFEKFCKNVIDTLCEEGTVKHISELQDKYTYKSIISHVSVLTLTLFAEQAQVSYDYQALGQILKCNDPYHQATVHELNQRMRRHSQSQIILWNTYKDIDDIILPDETIDIYSVFQASIQKILQSDLEDHNKEHVDPQKLKNVLSPLALNMVQIDELTWKCKGRLSSRVFKNLERFFKEFIDFTPKKDTSNVEEQKRNHQRQKNKKKQIFQFFCDEISAAAKKTTVKDFQEIIQQRVNEIIVLQKLYLNVIEYEKLQGIQNGNLLAQLISYHALMLCLQDHHLQVSFQGNLKLKYGQMIDNINEALRNSYLPEAKKAEDDEFYICQKSAAQYLDQMKEVRAFMLLEDYQTYKNAMDEGIQGYALNKHNVQTLEGIIKNAVSLLVQENNSDDKVPPNQFFDVALKLLSDKRVLQETNYDFRSIISTLNEQTQKYEMYERFKEKENYCVYYRIKIDEFLPEDMRVPNRYFIYRTPYGYNQGFAKEDLSVLLSDPSVCYSKNCEVNRLQPLSYEVRMKYDILPNTKNLSETPDDVNQLCPPKFRAYFRQNFKKQFFFEQCPSSDPAEFDEEYVITIYEVRKNFPTMTMIQEVYRQFEKRLPRVKIELWGIQVIAKDIQTVLRTKDQQSNSMGEAMTLESVIQKYITNDDVGGGIPKILDLYFSENEGIPESFIKLTNIELKRSYLNLFKEIERQLGELQKVVELFSIVGRNSELSKLAEERLEDRIKKLNEKRVKYKLSELQENF